MLTWSDDVLLFVERLCASRLEIEVVRTCRDKKVVVMMIHPELAIIKSVTLPLQTVCALILVTYT